MPSLRSRSEASAKAAIWASQKNTIVQVSNLTASLFRKTGEKGDSRLLAIDRHTSVNVSLETVQKSVG
jgi:hypothetical protein